MYEMIFIESVTLVASSQSSRRQEEIQHFLFIACTFISLKLGTRCDYSETNPSRSSVTLNSGKPYLCLPCAFTGCHCLGKLGDRKFKSMEKYFLHKHQIKAGTPLGFSCQPAFKSTGVENLASF